MSLRIQLSELAGHVHDLTIGLGVLSGILTFLVIEKIVRIYGDGHAHGHSHKPKAVEPTRKDSGGDNSACKKTEDGEKSAVSKEDAPKKKEASSSTKKAKTELVKETKDKTSYQHEVGQYGSTSLPIYFNFLLFFRIPKETGTELLAT